MNIEVSAAVELCRQLQEWLGSINESGITFLAGFTYVSGTGVFDVSIGDICVWSSCDDLDHEFTFSYCVAAFQEHIAAYAQYLDSEGSAT